MIIIKMSKDKQIPQKRKIYKWCTQKEISAQSSLRSGNGIETKVVDNFEDKLE